MSKAKEIADERLAKGEITAEEHKALISQLSSPIEEQAPVAQSAAPLKSSTDELPKGSYLWGIAGLVMCVISYNFGANTADNAIMACQRTGNSFEFCQQNGVRWPVIYAIYAFSGFMLLFGGLQLFLPKK